MPVNPSVIVTSTVIFHHQPPPLHPFHTLCIRLRSAEPESKTSHFIRSCHSCFKNCIPIAIFPSSSRLPGPPFAFSQFHIALQERATLCLFDFTSFASLSIPTLQSPLTPHFHFAFTCPEGAFKALSTLCPAARPRALRLCISPTL